MLDIEATKYQKLVIFYIQQSTDYLLIFGQLYPIIAKKNSVFETGEIEIEASYSGARCVKGNDIMVREVRHLFLVCKDALQCVATQIVKDCSKSVLIPIIEELASKASVIYSDGFKSYAGIIDYDINIIFV